MTEYQSSCSFLYLQPHCSYHTSQEELDLGPTKPGRDLCRRGQLLASNTDQRDYKMWTSNWLITIKPATLTSYQLLFPLTWCSQSREAFLLGALEWRLSTGYLLQIKYSGIFFCFKVQCQQHSQVSAYEKFKL